MATVSSGIAFDAQFPNLKELDVKDIRPEVFQMLIDGENVICAFKTIRDQVVFTDKRIFVINVQGVVGKKIAYYSYPYSKIQYFGIETAGLLDIDSEMTFAFSNGSKLQFDFRARVDIKAICRAVSNYII